MDENSIINIDGIITEDSTSGKTFWDSIYHNKRVLNSSFGCGEIPKEINRLQKIHKGYLLIALDYDVAGKHMIDIYKDTDIDMGKLLFISMESFEEVICNSEFILQAFPEMRDRVINYKDYMDATYKHAGNYFSNLLFRYAKQPSPYAQPNDKLLK